MSDGTQQGWGADEALKAIMGGEQPKEVKTPSYWLKRLEEKSDDCEGYDKHAEVMAKYIVEAYKKYPMLKVLPNSDTLKKIYSDEKHPFRQALSEATGFTGGWAFNIARYALGLPPQQNPAIIEI